MLLKKLIKNCPTNIQKTNIKGLAIDSRKVKKDYIFFALKGNKLDGETFIDQAIKKGAKIIICSKKSKIKKNKIIIIKVTNIRKYIADICKKFFHKKPKNIFAVTGTNGKSSVADFFFQILKLNKIPVASIGTLGIKKNSSVKKILTTSPDIITLHEELVKIKKTGIDNVIIEASSHGLNQGRLNGINFTAGVFTNFSQDHLDYHKSMKNYFNAKMILLSKLLREKKSLITDSKIKEFKKIKKIARKKNLKIITIKKNLYHNSNQIKNLIGAFQIKNLLMAIEVAKISGLKNKKIIQVLKSIASVEGRLQIVKKLPNKAKVLIDFAHTPDALETVLSSLKDVYGKNITIVFGCGGERDKNKRSLMAKIASKFCNKIYITDDNPRRENPSKIRKTLIKSLFIKNYFEIGDRRKAIKSAMINSSPDEIILIAGKGHENFQDYGNKLIKISDKKIVKMISFKKKLNKSDLNRIVNNKILNEVLSKNKEYKFEGVSIDSRNIKKQNLFIAIKGKKDDGHLYVKHAIKKGAKYCVVSKNLKKIKKGQTIKTKNTYKFLNNLAEKKRKTLETKVIAITGSVGKTSVKTMIGNLLNNFGDTYFSPRSFNNHYGVPISLSNLEHNHKFGVFEVGMSKPGEIKKLSKLIKPDIGIITNIAEAHIENFKNLKGIAKAKSEIISNIKSNGILFLNRDDSYFSYLNKKANIRKLEVVSFGLSDKSDIYPIFIKKSKEELIAKINVIDEKIVLTIKKDINIYNILCALGVIKKLRLDLKVIENSSVFVELLEGRGKIHVVKRYKKNFNLIDESYNASPLSVKNAISNFSKIKKKNFKKYVLLGDMLELGSKSNFFHKNLSKIINKTDIDKMFVYGDKILNTYKFTKKNKQGNILQHTEDFDEIFSQIIKKNDYLMIKGSNATGLNKLSKQIINGVKNVI